MYYDAYNIDPLLVDGENVLGILLGNGLQNNPGGYVWDFDKAAWRGAPRLALSMVYTDERGEERTLQSDESFRTAPSPILFDDFRYGEIYDGRMALPGWAEPGFDDTGWREAVRCDSPTGEAMLCDCEPIVVVREREPVAIVGEPNGWRYDFGVNSTGVCRLRVSGQPGQLISLYHGEYVRDGCLDMANLKFEARYFPDDMVQRDQYVCRGDGEETYTPTFTYHGFRYVLVTGIDEAQANEGLLTYLEMHSDLPERGGFDCADPVVNSLQEITRRSDTSNFLYFPTDCPHREKNGWTADAALSAEHVLLNLGAERSYGQWLDNIRRAQDDRGALPGIIPTGGWGFAWGNGPAWDNVLFVIPYYLYLYRGDAQVVRNNAGAMLRYLHYIGTRLDADGLLAIGLGDWCPVGRKPNDSKAPLRFTDSVLTADMAEKAAYLFEQVGLRHEAAFARAFYAAMRASVRRCLLDLRTMTALGNCQAAQAMAIYYGMFEPGECPAAFEGLLAMIDACDGHMDCGVLGGRVLFHVLTQYGRSDLAYRMITRPDWPSYGYLLTRGATTLWELFDREEDYPHSMNHHFWGDISSWFMQALAGIRVNPRRAGAHEIDIRPSFVPQLNAAHGWYDAVPGRVDVAWKRTDDKAIELTLAYPAGATGWLWLESGYCFADGTAARPAEAGTYRIVSIG